MAYPEHRQRIPIWQGTTSHKKELAEKIGVSLQLSRIVSGKQETVSSDILIGGKELRYRQIAILGLPTVSVRKSYDISELGLSEGP